MKKLYEFTSSQTQKVEEKVPSKNEKGEEILEVKQVEKKVPHKFFVRKPNRALVDEAELYYGIQYSLAVKDGLLTKAQLASKFADEAKTFSKNEQDRYTQNYFLLFEKEAEFQKMAVKKDEERTEDEKKTYEALVKDIGALRRSLQDFELEQNSLFNHTAEARARSKVIVWWTVNLAYKGDETPLFGTGSYNEKLSKYDEIEEADDEFLLGVINKVLLIVSFWYAGRAEKAEDFDKILQEAGFKD
jgi:hypothetical protein